jgi:hypothetical protein
VSIEAREIAIQRFSKDAVLGQYIEAYKKILNQ